MLFFRETPRTSRTRSRLSSALASQILLLLVWLNSVGAQTVSSNGISLQDAVQIALKSNPRIRITEAGRRVADARLAEARVGKTPVVQASESLTAGNNPVFVFGSLLEQGRFSARNFAIDSLNNPGSLLNSRSSVSVRVPLLDQGQTSTRIARARLQQRQSDSQAEYVTQQVNYEVIRSFFGAIFAREKKRVAEDAMRLAEADLKRTSDRVEVGTTVKSDLYSAEVQLAGFRQQLIQADGELVIADAAFNSALGLSIDSGPKLLGVLSDRTFPVESNVELARLATVNRQDLASSALSVNLAKEMIRGVKAENQPRADVFGNVGVSTNFISGASSDYTVGGSLSFTLFDAGRKARSEHAQAAEAIAMAERDNLENQIRFEVVRANQQYLSARARIDVATRAIVSAAEALRIVQDRYDSGLTTITDVLRAETALVGARLDLLAARYEHYVGYASLLLATGRLIDVRQFD